MLLRSAPGRRTALLGRIFRTHQRKGRAFTPKLPTRERDRAVGVLRLRLHNETGRAIARPGGIISCTAARTRSTIARFFLFRLVLILLSAKEKPRVRGRGRSKQRIYV